MEAEITLSYANEKEAEAVAKAVSPDNVQTPKGLTVQTFRKGCKVVTHVRCEMRLQTFLATLDDLLRCVSVAEKTLSVAKEK